jgi:WD40 repeat protein
MNKYKISKISTFTGHSGSIYALSKGPEPFSFFSGGSDRTVAAWNLDALQPENFSIKLDASVFSLFFLKNENLLLIGDANGTLYLIDIFSRKLKGQIKAHDSSIFSIQFHQPEQLIFTASADGHIAVIKLEDLSFNKIFISPFKVRGIDIFSEENLLAIVSGDCSVENF